MIALVTIQARHFSSPYKKEIERNRDRSCVRGLYDFSEPWSVRIRVTLRVDHFPLPCKKGGLKKMGLDLKRPLYDRAHVQELTDKGKE